MVLVMSSVKLRKHKAKREMLKKRCLSAVNLVPRKSTVRSSVKLEDIEQAQELLNSGIETENSMVFNNQEGNVSTSENSPMERCISNYNTVEEDISNLLSKSHDLLGCNVTQPTRNECCKISSNNSLLVVHTDHSYLTSGSAAENSSPVKTSSCSSIPDAELMQDFFLYTTNMISYQPIAEAENLPPQRKATTLIGWDQTIPNINVLKVCENPNHSEIKSENVKENVACTPTSKDNEDTSNTNSGEVDDIDEILDSINAVLNEGSDVGQCPETPSTTMSDPDSEPPNKKCKVDDEAENDRAMTDLQEGQKQSWMTACKSVSDQVQQDVIVDCAISLMTQMWTEYMNLTFDELRQREIESAHELKLCDEVIEMLEDKGRYIWQLIEEMEPINFSTDMDCLSI